MTFSQLFLGCTSQVVKEQAVAPKVEPTKSEQPEVIEATKKQPVKQLPLSPELVYYLVTAEIAGQRGQVGAAVDLYHKASTISDSISLAGRSAELAMFSRDRARTERALAHWQTVDPSNDSIYIRRLPFLLLKQDYQGVVESVNEATRLAPEKNKEYMQRLAANLIELAPPNRRLAIIEQTDVYQTKQVEALFAYSRLAAYVEQYDLALPKVEQVLESEPEREDALILKAEILQNMGKGQQALAVLKPRANSQDDSWLMRFSYAKLLGQNGKLDQAKSLFQQLYQQNPKNQEVLFSLGLLGLEKQNNDEARKYFTELKAAGDSGKQADYFMGVTEQMSGNTEKALIWFAAVPRDSRRYDAAQNQYLTMLADNGKMDKARLHLKQLRQAYPKQAIQYYLFEAQFLIGRGQLDDGFDVYTAALQQYPDNFELLHGRAMVSEPLNKLEVLEQDLNKIIAKDPNNHQALNALGYTLADRTSRYQEAYQLISKAVSLSPNNAFYLDSLGWVYYRLGELDKAENYLREAVNLLPDVEMLTHLGEVLWQQNKQAEAKQVWQQAKQKQQDNHLLSETMRRFGL